MATKEAKRRAVKKYLATKDYYQVRMAAGEKEKYQNHAATKGESLNGFILRALEEAMKRDTKPDPKP